MTGDTFETDLSKLESMRLRAVPGLNSLMTTLNAVTQHDLWQDIEPLIQPYNIMTTKFQMCTFTPETVSKDLRELTNAIRNVQSAWGLCNIADEFDKITGDTTMTIKNNVRKLNKRLGTDAYFLDTLATFGESHPESLQRICVLAKNVCSHEFDKISSQAADTPKYGSVYRHADTRLLALSKRIVSQHTSSM